jgi:hypothetical protein
MLHSMVSRRAGSESTLGVERDLKIARKGHIDNDQRRPSLSQALGGRHDGRLAGAICRSVGERDERTDRSARFTLPLVATTLAPLHKYRRASACPMPFIPPITTVTLLFRGCMVNFL